MVGRLRKLYGIVLGRMRFLNERQMHPPVGRQGGALHCMLEPLEPRLLLDGVAEQQALELFSISPALFVENQGQWADESVRFVHNGSGANVAMTDAGPVFQVFRQELKDGTAEGLDDGTGQEGLLECLPGRDRLGPNAYETYTLQFSASFVGAAVVAPVGMEQSEAVFNYFLGDDASRWREGVPSYEAVAYEGLYDGIDLHTWGQRDSLKYEFHVAPGADYSKIQVRYDGIEGLSINEAGQLVVNHGGDWGQVMDDAPVIYQEIDGERVEAAGRFVLLDEWTYSFEVTGGYDPTREVVIEANLTTSIYLGGTGKDHAHSIAVDASENTLVMGQAYASGPDGNLITNGDFEDELTDGWEVHNENPVLSYVSRQFDPDRGSQILRMGRTIADQTDVWISQTVDLVAHADEYTFSVDAALAGYYQFIMGWGSAQIVLQFHDANGATVGSVSILSNPYYLGPGNGTHARYYVTDTAWHSYSIPFAELFWGTLTAVDPDDVTAVTIQVRAIGYSYSQYAHAYVDNICLYGPVDADVGDSLSAAADLGALSAGETVSRSEQVGNGSYGSKDVDLYKFTLDSAGTVTLDVDAQAIGSSLDGYLRLFNFSGGEITYNDDHDGLDSYVSRLLSPGIYYVGVSGFSNTSYDQRTAGSGQAGSTGIYALTLVFTPTPSLDSSPKIEYVEILTPIQPQNASTLAVRVSVPQAGTYQLKADIGDWAVVEAESDGNPNNIHQFAVPAGEYTCNFTVTPPGIREAPATFTLLAVPAVWPVQPIQLDASLAVILVAAGQDVFSRINGLTGGLLGQLRSSVGLGNDLIPLIWDIYTQVLVSDRLPVSDETVAGYGIQGPNGATICTAGDLATAFAPVLKMDSGDPADPKQTYLPRPVELLLNTAVLCDENGKVPGAPTGQMLGQYAGSGMALDLNGQTPAESHVIYQNAVSSGNYPPTAYWTLAEETGGLWGQSGRLALQYWFCYYYNDWPREGLAPGCDNHEGDWEMITIVFDRNTPGGVAGAAYSVHDNYSRALGGADLAGGNWHAWDDVERVGEGGSRKTHPVVYVAQGSHANFFCPGRHDYLPPLNVASDDFDGQGIWLVATGVDAGTGPGGNVPLQLVSLPRLTEAAPANMRWLQFSGKVGGDAVDILQGKLGTSPAMPPYAREEGFIGALLGAYLGIGYGDKWINPATWATSRPAVPDDAVAVTVRRMPFTGLEPGNPDHQLATYHLGQLAGNLQALDMNIRDTYQQLADDSRDLFLTQETHASLDMAKMSYDHLKGISKTLKDLASPGWEVASKAVMGLAGLANDVAGFVNNWARRERESLVLQSRINGLSDQFDQVEALYHPAVGTPDGDQLQAIVLHLNEIQGAYGSFCAKMVQLKNQTYQLDAKLISALAHLGVCTSVLFPVVNPVLLPTAVSEFQKLLETIPEILAMHQTLSAGYRDLLGDHALSDGVVEALDLIAPPVAQAQVKSGATLLGYTNSAGRLVVPHDTISVDVTCSFGTGHAGWPANVHGPLRSDILVAPDGASTAFRPVCTTFLAGETDAVMNTLREGWADVAQDGAAVGTAAASVALSAGEIVSGAAAAVSGGATPIGLLVLAAGIWGIADDLGGIYGACKQAQEDAFVGRQYGYLAYSLLDQGVAIAGRYGYSDSGLSFVRDTVGAAVASNDAFLADVQTMGQLVTGPVDALSGAFVNLPCLAMTYGPILQGTVPIPQALAGISGTLGLNPVQTSFDLVRIISGSVQSVASCWSAVSQNPWAVVPGHMAICLGTALAGWAGAKLGLEALFGSLGHELAHIASDVTNGVIGFGSRAADLVSSTSSQAIVTLTNTGGEVLHVIEGGIHVAGDAVGQFFVRLLPKTGAGLMAVAAAEGEEWDRLLVTQFDLEPNESRKVELIFDPTTVDPVTKTGAFDANFVLVSSDADENSREVTIQLHGESYVDPGTSAEPDLVITGPSQGPNGPVLGFGDMVADGSGGTSAQANLRMENQGLSDLHINSLSLVVGTDKAFALIDAPSEGIVLRPGEIKTATVSCAPTLSGLLTGSLIIQSDDPLTPTITIGLAAQAGVPTAAVHDASGHPLNGSLDLGSSNVGVPATSSVLVKNNGDMGLTLSWSLTGSAAFAVASPSGGSADVPPGQTVELELSFNPDHHGPAGAALVLATNDPSQRVISVDLVGEGVDVTPPTVQGVSVVQHDSSIVIEFSEPVAISKKDLSLLDGAGIAVDLSGATLEHAPGMTTALLRLPVRPAPGYYSLIVSGSCVQDLAANLLDGDSNGMAGGDYQQHVMIAIPGDVTLDGSVDAMDYITLKRNFGSFGGAVWDSGDLDGDGDVDWHDLQTIMGCIGTSLGPAPAAAPTEPKPTTAEPVKAWPTESTESTMPTASAVQADVVEPELLPAPVLDVVAQPEPLIAPVADVLADAPPADVLAIAASVLGGRLAAGWQIVHPSAAGPANHLPTLLAVRLGPLPRFTSPLLSLGRACPMVADVFQLAAPWWSGDSLKYELPDEPWMTWLTVDILGKPRKGRLDPVGLDVLAVSR